MDLFEKLTILADAAKYDVACTSSGADRRGKQVNWATPLLSAAAIVLRLTGVVFRC